MARTDCLTNFLIDVSDSIKEKKKDNTPIKACNFDEEINNLTVGGGADLSEYFTQPVVKSSNYTAGSWITSIKKLIPFNTELIVSNNFSYLFSCFQGEEIDFSNFDTTNITTMSYMFYTCTNLTSLDLSSFDTSNVTDMNSMFHSCDSLTSLDLSSFDTSNVTSMSSMFRGCIGLTSLDLSSFDTSNVTTFGYMFEGCKNIMYLDMRNFDFTKATPSSSVFGQTGRVPTNCLIIVKDETARQWVLSCRDTYTNVKTVAEYEEIGG